jgi:hypothetical protein
VRFSRRSFLSGSGQVLGAGWVALNRAGITTAAAHAHAAVNNPELRSLGVLTAATSCSIAAATSHIGEFAGRNEI